MTPIMSRWRLKGIGDDIILRVLRRTFSASRVPSAYTAETGGEASGWLCQASSFYFFFCSVKTEQAKNKEAGSASLGVKCGAHVSHCTAKLAEEMCLFFFSVTANGQ